MKVSQNQKRRDLERNDMRKKKRSFKANLLKIWIFLNSYVKYRVYHLLLFLLLLAGYIGIVIGVTVGNMANIPLPSLQANVQIIP